MVNKITRRDNESSILIIADGAAYGCVISATLDKMSLYKNYSLYLPESFEWLLLKSGVIKCKDIDSILANPQDYIESADYFSWERFFTCLIEKVTEQSEYVNKYNKKGSVPFVFKYKENIQKVLSSMPHNIVLATRKEN